jgi:hypothetical protein
MNYKNVIDFESFTFAAQKQCAIPEDFKDPSITLDVLDFLGIHRAEPLHVKKTDEQ